MGRVGFFDNAAHPVAWTDPAWVAVAWFDPDYLELGPQTAPLPWPATTFRTRLGARLPESTRETLFRTHRARTTFISPETTP